MSRRTASATGAGWSAGPAVTRPRLIRRGGVTSASTRETAGSPRRCRAASTGMPSSVGRSERYAATSSASRARRVVQWAGSASQSPATGAVWTATPIAVNSPRLTSSRRRSSSASPGVPWASPSSAARRAAEPRRRSSGGWGSSTVRPASTRRRPGSRSTARSPMRSGRGSGRVSRTVSAPSGRTRTGTAAEPMWATAVRGSSEAGVPPCTRTSQRRQGRKLSGVSRASPRPVDSLSRPRRLTATRAVARTRPVSSPRACSPLTRTGRLERAVTRTSPLRIRPAPRVPVTTSPLPRTVNDRSIHSRTGDSASPSGSRATSRSRAARSSPSPAPVRALTATASTSPRVLARIRSRACAVAGPGSATSHRVTTSSPCRTPRASTAARCSADWGIQPPSAATTNSTAGTGPTPASMVGTNLSCPGTSTNASRAPDGRSVHAKPRSMVRPRRRSSARRSGWVPVSAWISVLLPWSTCPAVAMTRMITAPPRAAPPRGCRCRTPAVRTGGPAATGRAPPARARPVHRCAAVLPGRRGC